VYGALESVAVLWRLRSYRDIIIIIINTTILLVNGRGTRKQLLVGENLLGSCLGLFGRVTTSPCPVNSCVQFPVCFNWFKNFSAIFFPVLA